MENNNIQPTTQTTSTTTLTPIQPQFRKPDVRKTHFAWIVWLLVIVIILLAVATGYLWWRLNDMTNQRNTAINDAATLQTQVNNLKKTAVTACEDEPSDAMKTSIKTALDNKNLAAFSGYLSDPVEVVIAASEQGGEETPAEAVGDMAYIGSATGPWDFDLPDSTISAYESSDYSKYFDENTYVGKAASGQIVAFNFDCNDKINQVFLSASEGALNKN